MDVFIFVCAIIIAGVICLLVLSLPVFMLLEYLYEKKNLFIHFCHDKLGMHVPDCENKEVIKSSRYDNNLHIAYIKCKYCDTEIKCHNICKYIFDNKPELIADISKNDNYFGNNKSIYGEASCSRCLRKSNGLIGIKCCPNDCEYAEGTSCNSCKIYTNEKILKKFYVNNETQEILNEDDYNKVHNGSYKLLGEFIDKSQARRNYYMTHSKEE